MSTSPIVHEGLEGWVFLVGGTNQVIDQYNDTGGIGEDLIAKWVDLIVQRAINIEQLNAKFVHLFAPEKLSVYPEFYGDDLPNFQNHPISKFMSRYLPLAGTADINDPFINPLNYFARQKQHYPLYWKTDSHWRFEGCFCAYQLICSKLGVQPLKDLHMRPFGENMIVFDLGGKLDPVVREKGRFYSLLKNARRSGANRLVKYKESHGLDHEGMLHVGSSVSFTNDCPSAIDAKVVVFGDSFSEYRPTLLTGMLAETFRNLHFVWSTSIDYSFIQRHKPDIVITECAERFMTKPPKDDFDLENYANTRLRDYRLMKPDSPAE